MARQRMYATKAELEVIGYLDKSALKALRLKPTAETPSREYWQGRGTVRAYDRTQCVAMREYRPATTAQQAALQTGRELVGTVICKVCGQRVDKEDMPKRGKTCYDCKEAAQRHEIAEELLYICKQDPLFLDTETTGLGDDDQVIELAIVDAEGELLFHSLVRPTVAISEGAAAVHGISEAELAAAPTWPEIDKTVRQLLKGRLVVAHNVSFDARLLRQTCRAHNLPDIDYEWRCTLDLLTPLNGGRWPRLARAVELAGVAFPDGDAHRAQRDAECVRRIVTEGFK